MRLWLAEAVYRESLPCSRERLEGELLPAHAAYIPKVFGLRIVNGLIALRHEDDPSAETLQRRLCGLNGHRARHEDGRHGVRPDNHVAKRNDRVRTGQFRRIAVRKSVLVGQSSISKKNYVSNPYMGAIPCVSSRSCRFSARFCLLRRIGAAYSPRFGCSP